MPRDLEHPPIDPWAPLRGTTPARIGLARSGEALALPHVLDLQIGHAKARDAVHIPMDVARIRGALGGREVLTVASEATDRTTYLRRPDLGRRLDSAAGGALLRFRRDWDVAFIVADGLSAVAAERHAAAVIEATLPRLDRWRIAPIVVATQARVALADDIGARLGARLTAILIGERPGLTVADSLGIYVTYAPKPGRRDSERNCISNVHGAGLAPTEAAARLAWLLTEARRRTLTGVALKDETAQVVIGTK